MDAVVTTRLHGLALSIKNGVPPLVIDPISGGRKVIAQARALGWNVAFTADDIEDLRLQRALDYCLSETARREVISVRDRAVRSLSQVRDEFMAEMSRTVARTG